MLRKKALIVEDNQTMRLGMVESLRREGYEVGEFDNAPEALQALQQQFFPLVVTDLKMAPMDGIALLREIKAAWPAVEV
ncbi:MAG: response regulator, partial [Calditrichaeota bacterium]|nr:response regulator [Calditrichota bacterium]